MKHPLNVAAKQRDKAVNLFTNAATAIKDANALIEAHEQNTKAQIQFLQQELNEAAAERARNEELAQRLLNFVN